MERGLGMAEYIEREATCGDCIHAEICKDMPTLTGFSITNPAYCEAFKNSTDVVEVVHSYQPGDVCIYGFGDENKSCAIVEIVRVLNDERGVAEVKFLKVFVDDTGNGYFNYLLRSGNTMNASFKYLKNITPRMDGEEDD